VGCLRLGIRRFGKCIDERFKVDDAVLVNEESLMFDPNFTMMTKS